MQPAAEASLRLKSGCRKVRATLKHMEGSMADWGYCEGGEDMNNLGMGILFLCFSLFLRFYSPREKGNMLGYKSPQQGMRRNVWFWSNRCFGKLALAGSAVYLAASIILLILGKTEMAYKLNLYIIPVDAIIPVAFADGSFILTLTP